MHDSTSIVYVPQLCLRCYTFAREENSRLVEVMLEPGTPPATRVRAANSILDHTMKAIEIEGLEARLTELEQGAEGTTKRRSGR